MINYQPLPENHRNRILAVIAAKGGKSQAARIFKRARQTIKAASAGLPVHPYVAEQIAAVIAARDAEGKNP
jgi:hypothetical protein